MFDVFAIGLGEIMNKPDEASVDVVTLYCKAREFAESLHDYQSQSTQMVAEWLMADSEMPEHSHDRPFFCALAQLIKDSAGQ